MLDLGDTIPLTYPSKPASPATVTVTIGLPDGTTAGPFSAITGTYTYTTTQAGRHTVLWVATGPSDAYSDSFDVAETDPGFVISLDDAKTFLSLTTTNNDESVRLLLSAATQMIENLIGDVVVRTWTETLGALNSITLAHHPVVSVSSVLTTQAVDLSSFFVLDGEAGLLSVSPTAIGYPFALKPYVYPGMPLDRLYYQGLLPFYPGQPLTITYKAGRAQVPPAAQLAARWAVDEWWQSQRGSMPLPPRGGDQEQQLVGAGYALPNRSIELLASMPKAPVVG